MSREELIKNGSLIPRGSYLVEQEVQLVGDEFVIPPATEPTKESAEWRKQRPLVRGVLDYFPDALMEVAYCSFVGNEQHNPGEELHWAKEKSTDEADALLRHLAKRGTMDSDGVRHTAKVAWRALALLQRELDTEKEVEHLTCEAYPNCDDWPGGCDAEKDN